MNFVLKITSDDISKEYTIPDFVEVQCGSGDEIGIDSGENSVRCSSDITDSSIFPTILRQIEDECGSLDNYNIQCLFNSVVIYEQEGMTAVKYRIMKMKDATSIREEISFNA